MTVFTNKYVDLSAPTDGDGSAATPYNTLASVGTANNLRVWIRRTGSSTNPTYSTLAFGSNVELLGWPKPQEYGYIDRDTSLAWDSDTADHWYASTPDANLFTFAGLFYISRLYATSTATSGNPSLLTFNTHDRLVNSVLKGSVDAPLKAPFLNGSYTKVIDSEIIHQRTDGGLTLNGTVEGVGLINVQFTTPTGSRALTQAGTSPQCKVGIIALEQTDLGAGNIATLNLNTLNPIHTPLKLIGVGESTLSVQQTSLTQAPLYLTQPKGITFTQPVNKAHLLTQALTLTDAEANLVSAPTLSPQTATLPTLANTTSVLLGNITTVPSTPGEVLGYESAILRLRQSNLTAKMVSVVRQQQRCIQISGDQGLLSLGRYYHLFSGDLQPFHTHIELYGAMERSTAKYLPLVLATFSIWNSAGLQEAIASECLPDPTAFWARDSDLIPFKLRAPLQTVDLAKAYARVDISALNGAYFYLCTQLAGV